jgi:membrane-associated HD superfamily phosphohydrolase
MENMYINHLAVAVCAISSLVVGGIWYSPLLFTKAWKKEAGITPEQLSKQKVLKTFGVTLILAYIMSYNLAFFLGDSKTDWQWGLTAGFLAGFGWAALSLAVISLFEFRSFKYMLINGGYLTLWFTLIGFILGIWR